MHVAPNHPNAVPEIRAARQPDVPTIVDVHQRAFQGFFLSFLGPAFLRQLYLGILDDRDGMIFVAEQGENVCGFVAGTAAPSGFYSRLLRQRWWRFALSAALPALKRPAIIPRLLRAFSAPSQASRSPGRGTLMSLAVTPDAQGAGLGGTLVRAFLAEASRRGLRQVDLTTDKHNNDGTNRFYRNLGFICERTLTTPEGREMNEYVIDVQPSAAPTAL